VKSGRVSTFLFYKNKQCHFINAILILFSNLLLRYFESRHIRKEMKMTKSIHSLILSVILVSVLTSCSLSGITTKAEIAQATQSLLPGVIIELTIQLQSPQPSYAVGQVIKFNYNIKNIGSASTPGPVTVTGATVTCPGINTIGNQNDALDSNEVLVCTSDYTITQPDLDKGSVTIIATANVNGVNSSQVIYPVSTLPPAQLTVTKTANPTAYDHVGQTITYTYVITNKTAGTLGPTQFTVTDPGISPAPFNCGVAGATIASNATVTCSAIYTVTQADMNAVSASTNAIASGGGVTPSQPGNVTIIKSTTPVSALTVGSTIKHQVVDGEWLWQIARCYGADPKAVLQANSQLSDPARISPGMTITVPNIGSVGKIYDKPCVKTHKVVSTDTWNSIALMYNADLAVLKMVNHSTLTVGNDLLIPLNSAGGGGTTPSPTTSKALTLTSTANPTTYSQVGQLIAFTYVIKNSGTENLGPAQFTVTDGLIGSAPFNCGASNTSLAPNATVTCAVNYSITQADMSATSIVNNATASGGGVGLSQVANATITKSITTLTLITMANPSTYNQVGQLITFTYIIKNSGTSNLGPSQFTVTDALMGAAPINCGASNTSLAPNATVTCTVNYTITEANLSAVSISNNATASGGGVGPSQPASSTIIKQ
jgi:LysM repeat protein